VTADAGRVDLSAIRIAVAGIDTRPWYPTVDRVKVFVSNCYDAYEVYIVGHVGGKEAYAMVLLDAREGAELAAGDDGVLAGLAERMRAAWARPAPGRA
jgi:hypothetical protein